MRTPPLVSSIPHEIHDSNGKFIKIRKEIMNQFDQFFAAIGIKLSNDVPRNLSTTFSSYLPNPACSSMFFVPATIYEIDRLIQNLTLYYSSVGLLMPTIVTNGNYLNLVSNKNLNFSDFSCFFLTNYDHAVNVYTT